MPFQVLSFLHPHILATVKKKYLLANHFSKALKVWSGFTNYPSFMSQNPHIHSIESRLTEISTGDNRSQGCIASSFFLWCSWKFPRSERVLAVHVFSTMAKEHPQKAQSCFQNPRARERVMKTHWNKSQGNSTLILPDGLYVRVFPPQHILQLLLRTTNKENSIWFWNHSEPCLTKSIVPCK